MKRTIVKYIRSLLLPVACMFMYMVPAHAQLHSDTTIYNTTVIYCDGDFINTSKALWLNNDSLSIVGHITNDQVAMNPLNGFTEFIGTTFNQTVNGLQPFVGYNVKFSNSLGVTLNQVLQVNHDGTFNTGIVTTARTAPYFPLVFGANSNLPVTPHNQSHVNGVTRTLWPSGTFTFPVGNGSLYRKIDATAISINTAGLDGQYYLTDAQPLPFTPNNGRDATVLTEYYKQEYWNMKPVGNVTTQFTVYYGGSVPKPTTTGIMANLRVAHKTDNAWWDEGNAGTTGDISTGSVTSLAMDQTQLSIMTTDANASANISWSPVTLGSINRNTPLPLNLLSFTAVKQNNAVMLTWVVTQQVNTSTFNIERSVDGINWTTIGSKPAAGNNASSITYTYADASPENGVNYYRLKMIDINGTYTYSAIRSIVFVQTNSLIVITPNPARDVITITGIKAGSIVRIIDMTGKIMFNQRFINANVSINVSNYAPAIYVVQVIDNDNVINSLKIVKQ